MTKTQKDDLRKIKVDIEAAAAALSAFANESEVYCSDDLIDAINDLDAAVEKLENLL